MKRLSPSTIGYYFYFECPRYLRWSALSREERASLGMDGADNQKSVVTHAIIQQGYLWEEEVIEERIPKSVVLAASPAAKRTRDRVFDVTGTARALKELRSGQHLYQGTLQAPTSLYTAFGLSPDRITVGECRPDLIRCVEVQGERRFDVIDVKASSHLKTSHKAQVVMYALVLDHFLRQHGIAGRANLQQGWVWLSQEDEPEEFAMNSIRPHVEEFLRIDADQILNSDPVAVPWHLHLRCEMCDFYSRCRKEAEAKHSVSLYPYMTVHARRFLSEPGLVCETLEDFKGVLSRRDAPAVLSRSASLRGRAALLRLQVEALLTNSLLRTGGASASMPLWEDIRLVLSLERDPFSGRVYALGFYRTGGKAVFGNPSDMRVFVAETPDRCDEIRREFIAELYGLLLQVHENNEQEPEWQQRLSVQSYVLDGYEVSNLEELLVGSLYDSTTARQAMSLLFHFHSESLLESDEHPAEETEFPLVVLSQVVRSMFAVPAPIFFNLDALSRAFRTGERPFEYRSNAYFSFELSNSLKGDAIFRAWDSPDRRDKIVADIRKELEARLRAKTGILFGIRERAKDGGDTSRLFAFPPKFSFPDVQRFRHRIISRLAFLTRYEKLLEYLEIHGARSLPRAERENTGILYCLKAESVLSGDGTAMFRTDWTPYVRDIEDMFSMLLSEDSEAGDRAQKTFPDFYYRDKHYLPRRLPVWSAGNAVVTPDGSAAKIELRLRKGEASPRIRKGTRWILQPRFTDWLSRRVLPALTNIDNDEEARFVRLIEEPSEWNETLKLPPESAGIADQLARMARFTPSQQAAFKHFLENTLTLVWGPPGTGKTHFIAMALLCLMEMKRKEGKPCLVMISGFTHASIENCLTSVLKLNRVSRIWQARDESVAKMEKTNNERADAPDILDINHTAEFLSQHKRAILGGTLYSISKATGKISLKPDVVVIDEASQLKVPEALVPLSVLKDRGRLLIVGDDRQLPPIVKGTYPEPEEGELRLHRSVFEVLRQGDVGKKPLVCQLLENFRMNSVLCEYPAEKIYGREYRSFSREVAERRLRLGAAKPGDPLIDHIIDPEYPLVICVLEGVRAGTDNELEATLVADLARTLRKRLLEDGQQTPYPGTDSGNRKFWKDGLFIVSPHHAQINLILKHLDAAGMHEPFVDTVDAMQGQEAECVIISYGVSDPEQAMMESEFIYSLNRLNVSITRGRSKAICFLPRPLLKPTLAVLERPESAEGIEYMVGLEVFAREQGDTRQYSLKGEENASLVIYRKGFEPNKRKEKAE